MANTLFNQYGQNQNANNSFGMSSGLLQAMAQASQMISAHGMTPEMLGRQLLSSGKMSEEQFNQYKQIANAITGKNY